MCIKKCRDQYWGLRKAVNSKQSGKLWKIWIENIRDSVKKECERRDWSLITFACKLYGWYKTVVTTFNLWQIGPKYLRLTNCST